MNGNLPRPRPAALALALLAALLGSAIPGCQAPEQEMSVSPCVLHAYSLTIEKVWDANEDRPLKPRAGDRGAGFNVELRHFKIAGEWPKVKELRQRFEDCETKAEELRIAEQNPTIELCAMPDITVSQVGVAHLSHKRESGTKVLITDPSPLRDCEGEGDSSNQENEKLYGPVTGTLLREAYILRARIDSYNDESGSGEVYIEYVRAHKGYVDAHLQLEKRPFTTGKPLRYIREESLAERVFRASHRQ